MAEMPPVSELEAKFFVSGVGVPHSRDTEVILHIDGKDYFEAIYDAIAETRSPDDVIYIVAWSFSPTLILKPSVSPPLGKLLHDKADLGVDVRVIVWTGRFTVGIGMLDSSDPWDSVVRWNAAARAFRKGAVDGVQVNIQRVRELRMLNQTGGRPDPPLQARLLMDHGGGKWGSRHQKYTLVYRKTSNDLRAFVGGLDFVEDRVATLHHVTGFWHDAGVELRGGAAASVWADFRTRWDEARTLPERVYKLNGVTEPFNTPEAIQLPRVPVPPQHAIQSNNSVRVLRSYWTVRESPVTGPDLPWATLPAEGIREVLTVYQNALEKAEKYIYIEDQYLNTPERNMEHDLLYPLIADAGKRRGVKVMFVIPGTGDPTDPFIKFDELSNDVVQSIVNRMFPSQINFAMKRVSGIFVHSKILMIDDKFIAVGCANFTDRSMEGLDTELQTVIVDQGSLIPDFRVRLWADHLGVDPTNPTETEELLDLDKSLGVFREEWMRPVGSTPRKYPNSRFRALWPVFEKD